MVFRTSFDRVRYQCDIGSSLQDVYVLDPNGVNEFDVIISPKKRNLQEYIDSFKDSLDVNMLIHRFENGDITALGDRSSLVYGDISGMPDSIQEIYRLNKLAKEYFNELPNDLKSQFIDITDFYSSVGSERMAKSYEEYISSIKKAASEVSNVSTETVG